MKQITSISVQQTQALAQKLARSKKRIFALSGDLGSGKTTFVQGFAKGLEIKDKIISPTFVLIRQHPIPHSKKILFHVDLYRLENQKELKGLGLSELSQNSNNIILIEWAQKAKKFLPKNTTWIFFETIDENKRKIKISSK